MSAVDMINTVKDFFSVLWNGLCNTYSLIPGVSWGGWIAFYFVFLAAIKVTKAILFNDKDKGEES